MNYPPHLPAGCIVMHWADPTNPHILTDQHGRAAIADRASSPGSFVDFRWVGYSGIPIYLDACPCPAAPPAERRRRRWYDRLTFRHGRRKLLT